MFAANKSGHIGSGMTDEQKRLAHAQPDEQLTHQRFLLGPPVSQLTGEEFAMGEGGMLRFRIADWYKQHGDATVTVDGVGAVKLDMRAVQQSLKHGQGRDKIAAFAAVPDVMRGGKIIHREPLLGATNGEFLHIAAPVKIGSKHCVVDVMVKSDLNGRRMYQHAVSLIEDLRQPVTQSGAVAADSAGKRSSLTDAGVAETVLRHLFSVKQT